MADKERRVLEGREKSSAVLPVNRPSERERVDVSRKLLRSPCSSGEGVTYQ